MEYLFRLFAISQGAAVVGLTIFVFAYYLPRNRAQTKSNVRWHILTVSISYILLTLATIKTAAFEFYIWGDVWYWIVTIAYIAGDISLIYVFRESVKKHKIEKLRNGKSSIKIVKNKK